MKAGFIGLGFLGSAMAQRLMSEGVGLTVWNRTVEKARALGCPVAEDPSALARGEEVIFLNVFDSRAVSDVLRGPKGLLSVSLEGKTIVDTTSNHCEDVREFHRVVAEKGGTYVEAPVLGSVVPASQGNLTVLVSGPEKGYEKARPYLEKLGSRIFFLGGEGLASRMKLVNNLLLGTFMAAIAEAVSIGESAGVDKERVLDILGAGAGNSGVLNAKREKLLKEDFSTHFSAALIYKDLHYLQDLARSLKRPLITGSMVKELFALTRSQGVDDLDFSVVYKVLKGL